jgi:putative transposase
LDAERNVYNASLSESLRRLDLMRQSKAWQAARAMPKHTEKAIEKAQDKAKII